MADSYPLPGRSIPDRADETPIREETAREALRGTEFDPDSELMNQMQDPREREIRNSLRLRGGMLLQDPDDDSVIDSGAVFEDSKGKTYNLEVGDSLPGFDEFLVSEIRPNERSGGFEVVALPRIGAAVSFTTGPSSAGRKFYEDRDAEARSRREQQALARTFMDSIIPGSSEIGLTRFLTEQQFDYEQDEIENRENQFAYSVADDLLDEEFGEMNRAFEEAFARTPAESAVGVVARATHQSRMMRQQLERRNRVAEAIQDSMDERGLEATVNEFFDSGRLTDATEEMGRELLNIINGEN